MAPTCCCAVALVRHEFDIAATVGWLTQPGNKSRLERELRGKEAILRTQKRKEDEERAKKCVSVVCESDNNECKDDSSSSSSSHNTHTDSSNTSDATHTQHTHTYTEEVKPDGAMQKRNERERKALEEKRMHRTHTHESATQRFKRALVFNESDCVGRVLRVSKVCVCVCVCVCVWCVGV